MSQLMTAVRRLRMREDGQDLMEYGLLAALIAVVAIAGISTIGDTIFKVFWGTIGQAV